jgi:hypothetical protein
MLEGGIFMDTTELEKKTMELMTSLKLRESQKDPEELKMRLEIHKMLYDMEFPSLSAATWEARSLANKLGRTDEERNLLGLRFVETIKSKWFGEALTVESELRKLYA